VEPSLPACLGQRDRSREKPFPKRADARRMERGRTSLQLETRENQATNEA
jgi:hypothetical protein